MLAYKSYWALDFCPQCGYNSTLFFCLTFACAMSHDQHNLAPAQPNIPEEQTDFGYRQVPMRLKTQKVAQVFHSVAHRYDCMNDCMSLGLHRFWKNYFVQMAHIKATQHILDVAGGTGDITLRVAKKIGQGGQIILTDINASMLKKGKARLINAGFGNQIAYVQTNAEQLTFADNCFDTVLISFGLRNITDKSKALRSIWRTLKPGGQLLILEFSKPTSPVLSKLYDAYSFGVLPKLGRLLAKDENSYRYLVESIRKHPDPDTLKNMIAQAGFEDCDYQHLTGNIVAIHRGYKY